MSGDLAYQNNLVPIKDYKLSRLENDIKEKDKVIEQQRELINSLNREIDRLYIKSYK